MDPTCITSGCRKHPDRALLTLMCAFLTILQLVGLHNHSTALQHKATSQTLTLEEYNVY